MHIFFMSTFSSSDVICITYFTIFKSSLEESRNVITEPARLFIGMQSSLLDFKAMFISTS